MAVAQADVRKPIPFDPQQLDRLLDEQEPQRDCSLAEIRAADAALADELAALMKQQAAIECSGFLEGQALQSAAEMREFVACVARLADAMPAPDVSSAPATRAAPRRSQ